MKPAYVAPDPASGRVGDAAYAAAWARAHELPAESPAYRRQYADVVLLDALMQEGYRLLDVGCGTAGYHRILARHGEVHGIDPIPEMIAIANRFAADFGVRGARYSCCTFEDLPSEPRYDAIRMTGTFGWYRPWPGQEPILTKARSLLRAGGVIAVSYVPADSPLGLAKALLAPGRTVAIRRNRFARMLAAAGFDPLLDLRVGPSVVVLAQAV
ncbi:MAG: class I SAM-dependent methyltransferase [Gemmatimonas sp.]